MSFEGTVNLRIKHQLKYKDGHLEQTKRPTTLDVKLTSRDDLRNIEKMVERIVSRLHRQQFGSGIVSFVSWLSQDEGEDKSKVRLFAVYDVVLKIVLQEDGQRHESQREQRIVKAAPIWGNP